MYDVSSSSALSGSTRPAPNCGLMPRYPRCLAVLTRIARISSGVSDGLRAISNAATPLTLAVATEVPVVNCTVPFGAGTKISTPGAATVMYFPWLALLNRRSLASVAVTAITFGSARPSETHVDDLGAALDRVIESLDDVHRACFRLAGAAEGADRDDVCLWGHAQQLSVGRDRTGHAGAVRMWGASTAAGVVSVADRAGEIGLVGVDLRIDHCNDGFVTFGNLVHLGKMKFVHDILCWIAQIGIGIVVILCQAISIFGLHRDGEPSGLDTADHLAHGLPIGDAQGVNRAAQRAYSFLRHNGKAETL